MKEVEPKIGPPKIAVTPRNYERLLEMSSQYSLPVEAMLDLIITEYVYSWIEKMVNENMSYSPDQAVELLNGWNRRN